MLLHDNRLASLTALRPIATATHLKHLTLADNPCTATAPLSAVRRAAMSLFPFALTLDGRPLSRSPARRPPGDSAGPGCVLSRCASEHSVYRPLQLAAAAPALPLPAPPVPQLPASAAMVPSLAVSRGAAPCFAEIAIKPSAELFVRLLLAVSAAGSPDAPHRGAVPSATWPRMGAPVPPTLRPLRKLMGSSTTVPQRAVSKPVAVSPTTPASVSHGDQYLASLATSLSAAARTARPGALRPPSSDGGEGATLQQPQVLHSHFSLWKPHALTAAASGSTDGGEWLSEASVDSIDLSSEWLAALSSILGRCAAHAGGDVWAVLPSELGGRCLLRQPRGLPNASPPPPSMRPACAWQYIESVNSVR